MERYDSDMEGSEIDVGGGSREDATSTEEHPTEDGGQAGKGGGRKNPEAPKGTTLEERASEKLLDKEGRKDEHEASAQDPEAFNMNMAENKNLDQPNGEIN